MVKTCSIPGPLRSLVFSTSMRVPIASASTPNGCEKLPPPITVLAGVEEEMFPVVASSAKLPLKPLNGKYPSLGSVVPSSATAATAGADTVKSAVCCAVVPWLSVACTISVCAPNPAVTELLKLPEFVAATCFPSRKACMEAIALGPLAVAVTCTGDKRMLFSAGAVMLRLTCDCGTATVNSTIACPALPIVSIARATNVCAPLLAVIMVSMPLPLAVATCVPSSVITSVRIACEAAAVATTCTLLLVSAAPLLGEAMLTVTVVLAGGVAVIAFEPLPPTHPLSSSDRQSAALAPCFCLVFKLLSRKKKERPATSGDELGMASSFPGALMPDLTHSCFQISRRLLLGCSVYSWP